MGELPARTVSWPMEYWPSAIRTWKAVDLVAHVRHGVRLVLSVARVFAVPDAGP